MFLRHNTTIPIQIQTLRTRAVVLIWFRNPLSQASAAPTCCHSSPAALPPPSLDTSRAYANSASSNASPAPIAIISPALAAPPLRLVAASLNTPSFRLLLDKSAHKFQTLSS